MVANGELSMGHARALISAPDPEALADEVVRRGLSVRETEKLARAGKPAKRGASGRSRYKGADADIDALERQLGDMLGLKVSDRAPRRRAARSRSLIRASTSST